MVDRLTSCAARALDLARVEASQLGHPYVGTEHLLIALAREEGAAAARVLASLDLTAERLRDWVAFIAGRGEDRRNVAADPPHSPRLQRVLASAQKEAARRGQQQVDTLQLLLALVRERQGLAVVLLEAPGVGLERIGGAMMRALREGATDAER